MQPHERIIVALDGQDPRILGDLIDDLYDHVGGFKIGLEAIYAALVAAITGDNVMPNAFDVWQQRVFNRVAGKLFLDAKLHDIPSTLGGAAKAIQPLEPKFLNVHASAGIDGMKKVVQNRGDALVLAVTILTSFEENDANLIFNKPTKAAVLEFARLAELAGVDGIICSPQELQLLKARPELSSMKFVTPGVRPEWAVANDQKRIMTPGDAMKAGADYLVIGRPITNPPAEVGSPVDAAQLIAVEIGKAA
jgi:orotidine-5'-phosphate decarboxylase